MVFIFNALILAGLVSCTLSVSLSKEQLYDDEIARYFSVETRDLAPKHEIVYFEHITEPSSRHVTRDAITDSKTTLKFTSFDEEIHLEMEQDTTFLAEGARVNYVGETGETHSEEIPRDCFYRGTVRNAKTSMVTISACAGIYGSIVGAKAGSLYIEPLSTEHALRRNIGVGLAHVVYQGSERKQSFCGVKDDGKMNVVAQDTPVGERSTLPNRYLKIQVLADTKVVDQRGANAQRCMEAMFHGVAARISLLPSMTASLLGITFADQTAFPTNSKSGDNLGATKAWLHAQDATVSSEYDVVAGVTSQYMDNLGLAWVSAACGGNRASITYVGDMQAVEVISHEIGHNLAMGHDTGAMGCPSTGYVMAAGGTCPKCEMGWTPCSVNQYMGFARGASCMDNP